MIKAAHSEIFQKLFSFWLKRRIKKRFSRVLLSGAFNEIRQDLPVLLLSNHHSWWDGFFYFLFTRSLSGKIFHVMMLEKQLARHMFFTRIGTFSVQPGGRTSVAESLEYSRSILENNENLLLIFPQGETTAYDERAFKIKSGALHLLKKITKPVQLVFAGIHLGFADEELPEVRLHFSAPQIIQPGSMLQKNILEEGFKKCLAELADLVLQKNSGKLWLKGAESISSSRRRHE